MLNRAFKTWLSLLVIASATAQVQAEVRFLGRGIPEEKVFTQGHFIAPNENEFWRLVPFMKETEGALISVGTFRALHDVGQGGFSHAVLLDYDGATTDFNRLNVEMIEASEDRVDYLYRLLGDPITPEERKALREAWSKNPAAERTHWAELLGRRMAPGANPKWTERMPGLSSQESKFIARQIRESLREFLVTRDTPSMPEAAWTTTFHGNDASFNKVQDMARAGRIACINGNLSGASTLQRISEALRASQVPVGALDLSNALMYVNGSEEKARFLANLRALPWASRARVLMTDLDPVAGVRWRYYGVPSQRFTLAVEKMEEPGGVTRLWKGSRFESSGGCLSPGLLDLLTGGGT